MSVDTNASNEKQVKPSSADHRVVVFGAPDDGDELKSLLTEHADMDAATAQLATRSLPGLLPQRMPQYRAAKVAAEIRALGLSAMSVPAAEVPNLSQAHQSHHVRFFDESLEVVDACDQPYSSPWSNLKIVSVGVVPSTAPLHHRPASALSMGSTHRSWNDGVHAESRRRPEVFIVLDDGPPLILASDEMNYEDLGRRRAATSSANFARLIDGLVKRATAAWITPSTRAFLDRGPVRHYDFRSRDDFRH